MVPNVHVPDNGTIVGAVPPPEEHIVAPVPVAQIQADDHHHPDPESDHDSILNLKMDTPNDAVNEIVNEVVNNVNGDVPVVNDDIPPIVPNQLFEDHHHLMPLEQNRDILICNQHGTEWYDNDELLKADVNGSIRDQDWVVRTTVQGEDIGKGGNVGEARSRLEMFLLMFPPAQLDLIVAETSRQLHLANKTATTKGEIIKLFGVILLITKYEFKDRADLWNVTAPSRYEVAPNFGALTAMSRNRFDELFRYIRFGIQPTNEVPDHLNHAQHRWLLVDQFVENFNRHRQQYFTPSHLICVDESISCWYGQGGTWINKGLPMYVAIDRKPENGCEIQNAACGVSGVMIQLKVVKGAIDGIDAPAPHANDPPMNHGTRILLDLLQPWFNSNRIVCADSYFASVNAANELLRRRLRFIGVVKTATRHYPAPYLKTFELEDRGDFKALYSPSRHDPTLPGLMSLVWMDRERRYFISSCSSTLLGREYWRKRWRQTTDLHLNLDAEHVEFSIQQPKVAEIYYTCCSKIDMHNRDRQDTLGIERKIVVHDWSKRVNLSILSINFVDTWKVWDLTTNVGVDQETQKEFYSKLLAEMIENNLDAAVRTRNNVVANTPRNVIPGLIHQGTGRARSGLLIHITPTKLRRRNIDGTLSNKCHQGRCRECGLKTKWCCSACLDNPNIVHQGWICHTETGRPCFPQHVTSTHRL